MSTSDHKRYLLFNGVPTRQTLRRSAIVTGLRQAAKGMHAAVEITDVNNDAIQIVLHWQKYIGIVEADGHGSLPAKNYTRVEVYWTLADGSPLKPADAGLIEAFMQGTTTRTGTGKKAVVNKRPGLINRFDVAVIAS